MTVLRWDKPARVMSRAEYESISADGAPPGVYTPNMSGADAATWRAKKIGGQDPRVEVRVLKGSQVLIVVRPREVRFSMNGPAQFTDQDWKDLSQAVSEARDALLAGDPL